MRDRQYIVIGAVYLLFGTAVTAADLSFGPCGLFLLGVPTAMIGIVAILTISFFELGIWIEKKIWPEAPKDRPQHPRDALRQYLVDRDMASWHRGGE